MGTYKMVPQRPSFLAVAVARLVSIAQPVRSPAGMLLRPVSQQEERARSLAHILSQLRKKGCDHDSNIIEETKAQKT